MCRIDEYYNIVTAEDLAKSHLKESSEVSDDDRRYFKKYMVNISKHISEHGREKIETMLLNTAKGHWNIGADDGKKFPESKYKNIISILVDEKLNESVYDSGDIGHPLRNTIAHDIDVELENRNKEPITDRSIEAVKEGWESRDDFIQRHIDAVKEEFGSDLELLPTDINLIYRSIVSDPDYDSYDIMKNDIKEYLNKSLRESKIVENNKVSKKNKFDYVMNDFGTGDLQTTNGNTITDRKQALAIAYDKSGLDEKELTISEQTSIFGYTYNELLPLIRTDGDATYLNIRKNNTLIEGLVLNLTDSNILFEYKNRNYNITKLD